MTDGKQGFALSGEINAEKPKVCFFVEYGPVAKIKVIYLIFLIGAI